MRAFRVRVPATSANLGPGFDCLGLALDLYLELECRPAERFRLLLEGEGADILPSDGTNLLVKAMLRGMSAQTPPDEARNSEHNLPPVEIEVRNEIPLARGLGSSSAATVAGVATGVFLAQPTAVENRSELDPETILRESVRFEGHPDNVAPAIIGDLVVSGMEGGRALAFQERWPEELLVVAVVPDLRIRTNEARLALPNEVAFADAVANASRVARLLSILHNRSFEHLRLALQDRLHQPYRLPLAVGLEEILEQLERHPDSLGAYLSGSGPTLVAICLENGESIGENAVNQFEKLGISAKYSIRRVDREGLHWESI